MSHPIRTAASTAGWGLFLTSSWTWCIGMWLPIVLLGMYGWPGFWLFAIPNVIGCAAMGYLVKSREHSQSLVEKHRGPMRWFSVATIAYQLFFLAFIFGTQGWMLGMSGSTLFALLVPAAAFIIALAASFIPWPVWPWIGTLLFAASMVSWGFLGSSVTEQIENTGSEPSLDLVPLAPLIILGFLACPWLDATFHRARQLAPSRHAFGIFGITFFAMLLFITCYYRVSGTDFWWFVLAFFCYQTIFTMSVHLREIRLLSAARGWGSPGLLMACSLIGLVIGYSIWQVCCTSIARDWLDDTYLRFMALYGLVFPAWILAFMLGRGRWTSGNMAVFIIGLLIALPMAELGMLHASKWWLMPAVATLLASAAIISIRNRQAVASSTS
ncbi:MAG: hypothetical protein P8M22_06160 [Phycisphaerales bacterium]|nr:hypothetical protein [Phycisphaerales bacterium]